MAISLPLFPLATPGQRYSCHGCGNCCRDFTVQLRGRDVERLNRQQWTTKLGADPIVEFRGVRYLRQRADGACVFLRDDGKCEIHAQYGFDEKPLACRMFPYMLAPEVASTRMGVSFACQSVLENKGALCASQGAEAARIAKDAPETRAASTRAALARGLPAMDGELEVLERALVAWLASENPIEIRLEGFAWLADSLLVAKLDAVRAERFEELVGLLVGALPDELGHRPVAPAAPRQLRMLRSAIFARVEDPRPLAEDSPSRVRATLGQFLRHGAWKRGGESARVPAIGRATESMPTFGEVGTVGGLRASTESDEIGELIARWTRASLEGGRVWGSGYYGWDAIAGVGALALNVSCALWLAPLHAARREAGAHMHSLTDTRTPTLAGVRWAISRIDRAAGRAPWLGVWSERARLAYLAHDSGLRRLTRASL